MMKEAKKENDREQRQSRGHAGLRTRFGELRRQAARLLSGFLRQSAWMGIR
jgi:hypothetical protein